MKTGVFYGLLGCIFVLSSCMHLPGEPRVSEIKEFKKQEEAVWSIRYDYKGRISAYGNTPVEYGNNEIRIGRMDWDYRGEQLLSATYFFSGGDVFRSESHCLLAVESTKVEVWKEVDYQHCGDTVKMESTYYSVPDRQLVQQVYAQYVYKDGNLTEIISRNVKADHEVSACHSYYSYDRSVFYESNLNMQSFFIDAEGPDAFFFILLDMNHMFKEKKLPTYIRYCVNRGKATYVAGGLYRMDGDLLKRGEIISDEVKFKVRMEFEYLDGD